MKNLFKNIGPGSFIAAAFIGPGTVTVCTLTGVEFGFTLLWAMALSIVATLVLQEMAARIGLVYGKGLAETVKSQIAHPFFKGVAILLILSAVLVGNAAYEAGNISGAVLGAQGFFSEHTLAFSGLQINYLSLIIGAVAFVLLYIGNYKFLEKIFIGLIVLMSLSFLITAVLTKPDMVLVLKSVFTPKIPDEGMLMVLGLIGTTVVPYNLFLHASLVREKWSDTSQLPAARKDAMVSIILGGIVSMAIIICGAAINSTQVSNVADLAIARKNLDPELLQERAEEMPMTGSMNFKWQMQQRSNQLYYAGQSRMNNLSNLLNPIAWAKFIEAWKRGDFKRKE